MMTYPTTISLPSALDTDALGQSLAHYAKPGDCILLRGDIGAGKSALARAFIRQLLGPDTEVPSPTFTLVQTYTRSDGDIWHADLYRLHDTQEAMELGLIDAFETSICLVEWPEILGDLVPENALDIFMEARADHHRATLTFTKDWASRLKALQ